MKEVNEYLDNFYRIERGEKVVEEQEQVKIPVEHPDVVDTKKETNKDFAN